MLRNLISSTTKLCQNSTAKFAARVALYTLILIGLLVVYSSGADPNAQFVYTNF